MAHKHPAVIFDMDGTLVDVSSVRHFVMDKPKDFDAFHAGTAGCPPNMSALAYYYIIKAVGYKQ